MFGFCSSAFAVDPVPLQSAYWRFEEGQAFDPVSPRNEDVILDSINQNHMRTFLSEDGTIDATPTYTNQVPTKPLKSGAANTLALDFQPATPQHDNQDIFTWGKEVDKGDLSLVPGMTIEAAFYTYDPSSWGTIIAKEGRPGEGDPDFFRDKLSTFNIKLNQNTSHLMVQQFDQDKNLVDIQSQAAIVAQQWYYVSVVNDGSTLSLWLDSDDGNGYVLQGSVAVNGMYEGPDPTKMDWSKSWTVGRGQFAGEPMDWFDGIIDEVRISNTALAPEDFLFAPPEEGASGDHNGDEVVDIRDYVVWRADPANNGEDDGYEAWASNYGNGGVILASSAVPEPAAIALLTIATLCVVARRRRLAK